MPVSMPVSRPTRSYVSALIRRERGERMRAPDLRHEPGGVPGRPVGQAAALDEHDVALAGRCQVVGDRGADDPTTDDHDPGRDGSDAAGSAAATSRSRLARCSGAVIAWPAY